MNKNLIILLSVTVAVGAFYLYQQNKTVPVSVGAKGVKKRGVLNIGGQQVLVGGQKSGVSMTVPQFDVGQFLNGIIHNTNANGSTTTATSQQTNTGTTVNID